MARRPTEAEYVQDLFTVLNGAYDRFVPRNYAECADYAMKYGGTIYRIDPRPVASFSRPDDEPVAVVTTVPVDDPDAVAFQEREGRAEVVAMAAYRREMRK